MPKFFSPGDLISDAAGLTGDNRVIFRMFINTLVWGAVCSGLMIGLLTRCSTSWRTRANGDETMFRQANVGTVDRIVRIALGALFIVLPFTTSFDLWDGDVLRYAAPVIGAVLVLTALVRFCPLYSLLGANTCRN
jgi:hypothetical protein